MRDDNVDLLNVENQLIRQKMQIKLVKTLSLLENLYHATKKATFLLNTGWSISADFSLSA